ncbi:MAG: hypothetical protein L0L69_01140 [Propionibacterium sp.]|nr:hypothetical protein [Propionibacterium sp.]
MSTYDNDPLAPPPHAQDPAPDDRAATTGGLVALGLSGLARVTAPLLLLGPYLGCAPAVLAGVGALVASRALRRAPRRTGLAVTGLVTSVIVFALLAGVATVWNVLVADPAVRDYDELHEVLRYARDVLFG